MSFPFSVFKRPNSNGKLLYHARFFDDQHNLIKTVALGVTSKNAAIKLATEMCLEGVVA